MGKIISKQIRGMSLKAKISLVLMITLLTSVFMYEGWYKPLFVQAATTSYNFTMDSTAVSLGADGSTSTGSTAIASGAGKFSMVTSVPATRTTALGTNTATTTETTVGTVYGPAYASTQYIYTPTLVIAGSRSTGTLSWRSYLYDYDPSGSTADKLIWTSNITTQSSGSSAASLTMTFSSPATYQIPASHRVKIVVKAATSSGTATASLYARTSSSVASIFSVNESTSPPGAAPTITSLTPSAIGRGASNVPFTITGTNFDTTNGVTVTSSSSNATMGSYNLVNSTTINGTITSVSNTGTSTITVKNNGDGQTATTTLTLNTYPGAPTISPASEPQGYSGPVTITSSGLVSGATVSFSGTGITVNGTPTYNSSTSLTANITIDPAAATGTRSVTVTNPDFGTRTASSIFTVNPGLPAVASTSPGNAYLGAANLDVAINGNFFVSGATVSFSGAGIKVNSVTYNSSSSLTANITISGSASLGAIDVTVKNPNGDSGTGTGVFTVAKRPDTIVGAMTFTNVTDTGMTVNQYFSGDANNSNTCTIAYGTTTGSYTNTVPATKGNGVYTATLSNLPKGADGTGVAYYFQATFSSLDGVTGTNPVLGSQATKASQLMHNSQNLASDKWTAQGGWGIPNGKDGAYSCSTCHSKGTGNAALVNTTILGNSVTYQQAMGDDSAHTTSNYVCEVCHSQTAYHRKDNSTNYTSHKGNVVCSTCHDHNIGFAPDSRGGQDCMACHTTLNQGAYHHALNSQAACLNCHADHNIFRSDINSANNIGRAANLKVDAIDSNLVPVTGAPGATYTNTDFVATATNGGVCVSCHKSAQTKTIDTSTPNTLPIYRDNFAASAHNYAVSSAYTRDSSAFQSNCSKCHSDDTAKKYQAAGNQFSTHGSSVTDILAMLGATTADSSAFCMRCHSRSSDLVTNGGQYKSQDTTDWYGTVPMASNAVDTFSSFYTSTTTTPVIKTFGHRPGAYANGLHKATETLADIAANKHVECADCHNAHQAKAGTNPQGTTTGNYGSPALIGALGVQTPAWPANWTAPAQSAYGDGTTLTQKTATTFEWQVCFKCHSGANTNVTAWGGSGAAAWTDLGLAFNPNNRSAHPVVVSLNNQAGSTGTRPLTASQMKAPWTLVGTQTMSCSDCHATDSTGGSLGPHGSGVKWMLSGTNKAWPYTNSSNNGTSSGTFFTMSNQGTGSGATGLFCNNCHDCSTTGHGGVIGRSDHNSASCVTCHIRVPHGGKVSRLITTHTAGLPARFAPDGNGGSFTGITGFTKAASVSGYSENGSCKTDCGHHGSSTGSETW